MSGGHFQYAYYHPGNFADELKMELDTADQPDEYGELHYQYEPATRAKLLEIANLAAHVSKLMREAEWLYSGDTGEDSFMKRVAKIEADTIADPTKPV
ncbi:hypothetical protein [Thiothrix winogradskyi]|uniref:Uncharacterized protein n=1 Tax=Thiothrix winogradskyi TaxID=96472 RepID=A0ABY3T6X0_9GAMM|nr:hypothetical protein [Thiothrix winogradskyi]UJS26295.1 hypothetical protein L2Y54_09710 [Thiothrix winogradskyi]